MYFGASIFPADAASTITSGITGALTDNLGVVLALMAFTIGLGVVFRLVRKVSKPKL